MNRASLQHQRAWQGWSSVPSMKVRSALGGSARMASKRAFTGAIWAGVVVAGVRPQPALGDDMVVGVHRTLAQAPAFLDAVDAQG
jgi:hypothetical protein